MIEGHGAGGAAVDVELEVPCGIEHRILGVAILLDEVEHVDAYGICGRGIVLRHISFKHGVGGAHGRLWHVGDSELCPPASEKEHGHSQ